MSRKLITFVVMAAVLATVPAVTSASQPKDPPVARDGNPIAFSRVVMGEVFRSAGTPLTPHEFDSQSSARQEPTGSKRVRRLMAAGGRELRAVKGSLHKLGLAWRQRFGTKVLRSRNGPALGAFIRAAHGSYFLRHWRKGDELKAGIGAAWSALHAKNYSCWLPVNGSLRGVEPGDMGFGGQP